MGVLNEFAKRMKEFTGNRMAIRITKEKILRVLKENISKDDVLISSVDLDVGLIVISGVVKKMGIPLSFSVSLVPDGVESNIIKFHVKKVKPLHLNSINKRIFNKAPYVSYMDEVIYVDLDQVEKVNKIPVGKMKGFDVFTDHVLIRLGI
ncbi:hypothetical protein QA612_04595 [Evansella sp. AB-P1]|uniref:hypothetical protein n=1 Tax=Evansella sp. AB-P1 TaxID=3037653 RepID=UPI00241F098C|nr:hypothetical protein [Evansella sp. AB-P1]MDG5786760.1 hypothetical protein [Evansella sp. AB-P1]